MDDNAIKCSICGGRMVPVWFKEYEYKNGIRTGRKRKACSHLECLVCGEKSIIDDSFDGPWL